MSRFRGKTAIITGASSGIGRATLNRLVSEGAIALAVGTDCARLTEAAELARKSAQYEGRVEMAVASVSDEVAVKRVVTEFVAREGRLDVLVNMAGIINLSHTTDSTLDDFYKILNTNVIGTFLFCREAIPHLLKTKGNIVNASSTSAFFGHPYMAAYSASKGAIAAMTRALAWEYMRLGVRVNAVAPGGISTRMTSSSRDEFPGDGDGALFTHLNRPDGQCGQPEDVAAIIATIASVDGAFVNGEIVRIDGGVHS